MPVDEQVSELSADSMHGMRGKQGGEQWHNEERLNPLTYRIPSKPVMQTEVL